MFAHSLLRWVGGAGEHVRTPQRGCQPCSGLAAAHEEKSHLQLQGLVDGRHAPHFSHTVHGWALSLFTIWDATRQYAAEAPWTGGPLEADGDITDHPPERKILIPGLW